MTVLYGDPRNDFRRHWRLGRAVRPGRRDPQRSGANWLRENRDRLVTSDYVVDEVLTLLKTRFSAQAAIRAGESLFGEHLAALVYLTPDEVQRAWKIFPVHADKALEFHGLHQPGRDAADADSESVRVRQTFLADARRPAGAGVIDGCDGPVMAPRWQQRTSVVITCGHRHRWVRSIPALGHCATEP